MIAYAIHLPPQEYENEGSSKILKDIKAQIKNFGKNSRKRHRAIRFSNHLYFNNLINY